MISVRAAHPWNAAPEMLVTPVPKLTDFNDEQPRNREFGMIVMPSGMVISVKLPQLSNALLPSSRRPSGSVILPREMCIRDSFRIARLAFERKTQ